MPTTTKLLTEYIYKRGVRFDIVTNPKEDPTPKAITLNELIEALVPLAGGGADFHVVPISAAGQPTGHQLWLVNQQRKVLSCIGLHTAHCEDPIASVSQRTIGEAVRELTIYRWAEKQKEAEEKAAALAAEKAPAPEPAIPPAPEPTEAEVVPFLPASA